jgi:hypothetical protein
MHNHLQVPACAGPGRPSPAAAQAHHCRVTMAVPRCDAVAGAGQSEARHLTKPGRQHHNHHPAWALARAKRRPSLLEACRRPAAAEAWLRRHLLIVRRHVLHLAVEIDRLQQKRFGRRLG